MTHVRRIALVLASATVLLTVLLVSPALALTDEIAPTTLARVQNQGSHELTILLTATDDPGGSGIATTYYQLDHDPETQGTSVAVRSPGMHTLTYWSVDNAGNIETAKTTEFTPLDFMTRCATCHGLGGGGR